MAEEIRVVDPNTGGAKGSKESQLGWSDPIALLEIGRVYGYGCTKYDSLNYRRGYKYSLSVNAMFRHILAWLNGESIDPESKCFHLAHAAWHCITLIGYELRGLGTDDVRWKK